jgi:hypothetical protein
MNNPFSPVEINQNLKNLYTILMQYLEKLIKLNHPKLNLITDVLDLLIKLRKEKDECVDAEAEDDEEIFKRDFDEIHAIAYKNITEIYDYDKEQDDIAKAQQEEQEAIII